MVSPFDKYFSEKSEKDIILEDNSNEKQENNASVEKKYQPTPEINQKQEETKKEITDFDNENEDEVKVDYHIDFLFGDKEKKLIHEYGKIRIYEVDGELYYCVPIIKLHKSQRKKINMIKEIIARLLTKQLEIKDYEAKKNIVKQKALEIIDTAYDKLLIPKKMRQFYADMVVREMVGYGLIEDAVNDDQLEEIMINGPNKPVYVFHRKFGMMKSNMVFSTDREIKELIDKIARECGRRIDIAVPIMDAVLSDGSRVCATIPPALPDGSTLTIRKFRKDPITIPDIIKFKTMSSQLAAFLWVAVEGMGAKPANILVAGGTGSGKTTTLNALCSYIPNTERVITIEDTLELQLPVDHWIRMLTRPPSIEGTGEITMDVLLKTTLRMRPDRIIVGEIRHKEAETLFTAMNTGHDGCMGTVHANSGRETIIRLSSPPMNVPIYNLEALDFVIIQNRIHDRRLGTIRRIVQLCEIHGALEGDARAIPIASWDAAEDKIIFEASHSKYIKKLCRFTGLNDTDIWEEINRRQKVLDKMVKAGIRELDKVKMIFREYYKKFEKDVSKK